ncbi:MAG: DUF202 domain-containing protein [Nitrospirae bacterium]|nr:DUF202 domain-containing protein [Nitrospirota bacterium]
MREENALGGYSTRKKNTMPYSKFDQSEMILRDYLAQDRTRLANERTFLAYLRTAITFSAAGGTLIKIFPDEGYLRILGAILLVLGFCLGLLGGWRFAAVTKKLNKAYIKNKTPAQRKQVVVEPGALANADEPRR